MRVYLQSPFIEAVAIVVHGRLVGVHVRVPGRGVQMLADGVARGVRERVVETALRQINVEHAERRLSRAGLVRGLRRAGFGHWRGDWRNGRLARLCGGGRAVVSLRDFHFGQVPSNPQIATLEFLGRNKFNRTNSI